MDEQLGTPKQGSLPLILMKIVLGVWGEVKVQPSQWLLNFSLCDISTRWIVLLQLQTST